MAASEPSDSSAQARVTRHFEATSDEWREVYDAASLEGQIYRDRRRAVLAWVDQLELAHAAPVLDAGCGAGVIAVELGRRRLAVEALDPSRSMVELTLARARKNGQQVRATVGSLYELPYPADAFQLALAVGVLPWLSDPGRALGELARVVRPGGHLIVSSDNRARLKGFVDPRGSFLLTPVRRRRAAARRRAGASSGTPYWQRWPSELNRLLAAAGLEQVERRTVGFGPFSWLGSPIMGDELAIRVHHLLQRAADLRLPGIRATGWHDLALARKPPAAQPGAAGWSP